MQRRRHGGSQGNRPQGARPQGGRPHGPRPGHSNHSHSRPRSYKINCSGCGKEFIVGSPPPSDKKLLCMECFKK